MVTKIISGAVEGVDGTRVIVEVDISPGLPGIDVVGLPDSAVKESKDRVRAAIKNSGYKMPARRITVNLAPASTKKAGAAFDLPIAVGILCGTEEIAARRTRNIFITGELSLDGMIRPVAGVLSMVDSASKNGITRFIVPYGNAREAAMVKNVQVVAVKTLSDLVKFFETGVPPSYPMVEISASEAEEQIPDFADVKGQEHVKRALEVAAAGAHNVLMTGPPGTGKSMLAKRVPGILGDLSFEESIEVTKIYSVAGGLKENTALLTKRPFRSPHHTASYGAIIGGNKIPQPGEISLSHNGVLFLDEFPEFSRDVREALRQPMEDGKVTISRAHSKVTFPSVFMLICAMNPCPCGMYGHNKCTCSQREINSYEDKMSGPLMDRIDIHTNVPRVDLANLISPSKPESSADVRARVIAARELQRERYKGSGVRTNARLTEPMINEFCVLNSAASDLLKKSYDKLSLSARAYHKILKVSRTIADLEKSAKITELHVAEALYYRIVSNRSYYL